MDVKGKVREFKFRQGCCVQENVELKAQLKVTLCDVSIEVGRITWENGYLEFEGNAAESAKEFFIYLKPMVDEYIKKELEKRSI